MPRSQDSIREGFTLIELLVVIAIISLLVSILLPSLNKAKDLARSVNCRVNLKNYGTGMQLYVEENDGVLPQAFYRDPPWYLRIAPYLGASDDGPDGFSDPAGGVTTIFRCPSMEPRAVLSRHNIDYGYNKSDMRIADSIHATHHYDDYVRQADIKHPTRTILIGDSVGSQRYPGSEEMLIDFWDRPVAMRHGGSGVEFDINDYDGAGNILFADTHTELVPVMDIFGQGREPSNGMLWDLPVTEVNVN